MGHFVIIPSLDALGWAILPPIVLGGFGQLAHSWWQIGGWFATNLPSFALFALPLSVPLTVGNYLFAGALPLSPIGESDAGFGAFPEGAFDEHVHHR